MSSLNIPMPREQLERIVRQIIWQQITVPLEAPGGATESAYTPNLVVNISARHLHMSKEHLEILFGPGAELTVYRWLYQPGEFASEQLVTVMGPNRKAIESVRILGPLRKFTQLELSATDSFALGITPPVRPSGQIEGTPGCLIVGPKGVVELRQGVIRAERHVHMSTADAQVYGFTDGQYIRLKVNSDCPAVFEHIFCRVHPTFLLEVHLDTDEGNACNLVNATSVELLP
ncbi:MAG: phosphate propanoyltransferase [Planctomycetes bacterium]|nr:phosphate propanoyltransferase [Planctomycetota bacterium]